MGIIARQSIKGTIATYFGVAIGFVTIFFILTKYLTPEEVGLTRVLVDAATLFSSLALMGTQSSTLRFYPHFKDDSPNQQGLYFWTLIMSDTNGRTIRHKGKRRPLNTQFRTRHGCNRQ